MKPALYPKLLVLIICCVYSSTALKAQYVTLPDSNFTYWLRVAGFAQCVVGGQLDTTCPALLNATAINIDLMILDYTGVQYFKALDTLYSEPLSNLFGTNPLPQLPPHLKLLSITNANLTGFSTPLPATLQYLDVSGNYNITSIPALPAGLQQLRCNNLGSLNSLPALPTGLTLLECNSTNLTALPTLPSSLQSLSCSYTQITTLPALPANLLLLNCEATHITTLPALPAPLSDLTFGNAELTTVASLPNSILNLTVSGTSFKTFPFVLPSSVQYLGCYNNDSLAALPRLPAGMLGLNCYGSHALTTLPALPPALSDLACSDNNLTSVPAIPPDLLTIDVSYNPNLHCLPFLNNILWVEVMGTAVMCLPGSNNPQNISSTPDLPLCNTNTTCRTYMNFSGNVFIDDDNDCSRGINESLASNVKINLSQNGVLKQQTFLNNFGQYGFMADNFGTYDISIDTTYYLPLAVTCPGSNVISNNITVNDTMHSALNFALACTNAIDLAVYDVFGTFIPGRTLPLTTILGDYNRYFGANCVNGTGGTVTLNLNGPVRYTGPDAGALTPTSVVGNTVTWVVADFGIVDNTNAFSILTTTDTTAQVVDLVCINVGILGGNDINPFNNNTDICHPVRSSMDPNEKEVSPEGDIDTTQKWLTYTLHFQNTGNAPAYNIHVDDTLDANICDISSIQMLSHSHEVTTSIKTSGALRFSFYDIMLPDSTTDEPHSHGYVRFKVKLKSTAVVGTTINNTAFIYFDYNPAVVTNTVTNNVVNRITTGVKQDDMLTVSMYPNPANKVLNIQSEAFSNINVTPVVFDITGKGISAPFNRESTNRISINTSNLAAGAYLVKFIINGQPVTKRFVVSE